MERSLDYARDDKGDYARDDKGDYARDDRKKALAQADAHHREVIVWLSRLFLIVEEFNTEAETDVHVARVKILKDVVVGDVEIEHGGIAAILTIGDACGKGGAEAIVDHVEVEALGPRIFEVLDIRRLDRDNRTDTTIGQIVNQGCELNLCPDTDVLQLMALVARIFGELYLVLVHAVGGIEIGAKGRRKLVPAEFEAHLEVVEEVEGRQAIEGVALHTDVTLIALHLQVVVVVDHKMIRGDTVHLTGNEVVDKHLAKTEDGVGVEAGAAGMEPYHPGVILGGG